MPGVFFINVAACSPATFLGYNKPLQLYVEKRQFYNQNNQWLKNIYR